MSHFTPEQRAAIDAQGRTIVSASAGSGKTTVMIQKMIELICDQNVDVTRILAVTYTKKAAASMKDKLRKALVNAINRPNIGQEEKARLKAQYRQVPLADISTIHSFCAKLIRTHFYATDVGNKFGIIADDDADGTALKSRAIENVFEQAYADGDEDFLRLLSVYFRRKKDSTLKEVILETHSKVRTHVGYREELNESGKDSEEVFDAICAEAYDWFVAKSKFYREEILKLYRFFNDQTNRADCVRTCDALVSKLTEWIDAGDLFTLASVAWGKAPNSPKVDEMEPPELISAVKQLLRLQDKVKKMNTYERSVVATRAEELKKFSMAAQIARSLAKYVLRFDEEYMRLKKMRGVLDYNDLEHYALALLSKEDIAAEMLEKYEYVFVDEYQDVNPVQERIISAVSGKNLFLVGDIKQSIYGFRGSKSKFFAEKWEEFDSDPTANALKLSKNFRSVQPVLDAVNEQFSRIMTKQNSEVDYKSDGVMAFGGLYEEGKGRVQLHFVGKDDHTDNEEELDVYSVLENVSVRKASLSSMAKKIKEIIELELKTQYYDLEEPDEEKRYKYVQYSNIAILDRKKKGSIAEIIAALAGEGIPVVSEAPVNICEFPEIKSLIELLRLLDNEQQDIPLASVLLSPIGGLTEDDLVAVRIAYRGDEEKISFRAACRLYATEKTDEIACKLNAFFEYFSNLRQFALVKNAGDVLTKVIADKQMEAAFLGGINGENCLKRIRRFIEESQTPGPMDVREFLTRLKMLDFDLSYCENGGENAVRVMTMHASKGLEFPVVILPNLSRSFANPDSDEVVYVDGYGLAPKAYDLENMTYDSTVLRLLEKRRESLETIRDELNLYYVALTRPQYALHMIFDEESEGSDIAYGRSCEDISDFSVWEKYKMVGAGIDSPKKERQMLAVEADEELTARICAAQRWEYTHSGCENLPAKTSPTALMKLLEAQSAEEALRSFVADIESEEAKDLEKATGGTDTLVGSAYHAFLEYFDFALLRGVAGDENLRELVLASMDNFRKQELLSEEFCAVLDSGKLVEVLKNPVFYRLGDTRLYKEQRFMTALPSGEVLSMVNDTERGCVACDDDILFQGAIDLLAVGENQAEIIDYKYSQKGEKALRETYSMQLRLYKMAMAKALKLPIENIRCTIVNIYRGFEVNLD